MGHQKKFQLNMFRNAKDIDILRKVANPDSLGFGRLSAGFGRLSAGFGRLSAGLGRLSEQYQSLSC